MIGETVRIINGYHGQFWGMNAFIVAAGCLLVVMMIDTIRDWFRH